MSSGPEQPRRRLYLDTSAYLCILLAEEGFERLAQETAGAELLSSVLLILESRRNLVRLAREGLVQQYEAVHRRLEEDTGLFGAARSHARSGAVEYFLPAVATPRSLDLAHLRTALWFHAADPIDRFVTQDASQEQAARELGLPV